MVQRSTQEACRSAGTVRAAGPLGSAKFWLTGQLAAAAATWLGLPPLAEPVAVELGGPTLAVPPIDGPLVVESPVGCPAEPLPVDWVDAQPVRTASPKPASASAAVRYRIVESPLGLPSGDRMTAATQTMRRPGRIVAQPSNPDATQHCRRDRGSTLDTAPLGARYSTARRSIQHRSALDTAPWLDQRQAA
jgi:hypothetical protein